MINSVASLREGVPQKYTGLPVNSVGKAERPFGKPVILCSTDLLRVQCPLQNTCTDTHHGALPGSARLIMVLCQALSGSSWCSVRVYSPQAGHTGIHVTHGHVQAVLRGGQLHHGWCQRWIHSQASSTNDASFRCNKALYPIQFESIKI